MPSGRTRSWARSPTSTRSSSPVNLPGPMRQPGRSPGARGAPVETRGVSKPRTEADQVPRPGAKASVERQAIRLADRPAARVLTNEEESQTMTETVIDPQFLQKTNR